MLPPGFPRSTHRHTNHQARSLRVELTGKRCASRAGLELLPTPLSLRRLPHCLEPPCTLPVPLCRLREEYRKKKEVDDEARRVVEEAKKAEEEAKKAAEAAARGEVYPPPVEEVSAETAGGLQSSGTLKSC